MPVEISKRRFTVDDYHRMGQSGILSEDDRVELVDGEVVTMSAIGPRHSSCIDRTNRIFVMRLGDRAIVRIQSSLRLDRYNEPEPDVMLLRPRDDFYAPRLPGPSDTLLVMEVSDSSIDYDREVKAPLYAASNVPEYWIANLDARQIECYSEPEGGAYRTIRRFGAHESVAPALLPDCVIAVRDLIGA
jgi:Uma2 family endonuclease